MKNKILLLSFSLLFTVSASKATIVWTNVQPHQVTLSNGTGASFDVDLDANATVDFRFTTIFTSGLGFVIGQAGQVGTSNYMLIDTVGGVYDAYALAPNANIDSTSTVWHSMGANNPNLYTGFFGINAGYWINNADYFLGVKFLIGADYHYGWIKMSVDTTTMDVTLKEYAYENNSNVGILAGAKGPNSIQNLQFEKQVGVKTGIKNTVAFYNTNKADKITQVTIIDIQGRMVKTLDQNFIKPDEQGDVVVSTAGLSPGVYIYKVAVNSTSYTTGKFFVH